MKNYWNLSLLSFLFSLVAKCWDFRNEPDLLPWSLLPTSFYSSQSQQLLVYFRSLRSRSLLRRSIDRVLSGDSSQSQTGIPIKQGSQIKTFNQNESRCYTHHLMKFFKLLFEIHIVRHWCSYIISYSQNGFIFGFFSLSCKFRKSREFSSSKLNRKVRPN